MKRFINTPFFCLIKAEQNNIMSYIEDKYDAFVIFILEESVKESPQKEKLACRNALVYTQTKLIRLLEISEKKRTNDYKKRFIFCYRTDYVCGQIDVFEFFELQLPYKTV
jgi:hypothetical protein